MRASTGHLVHTLRSQGRFCGLSDSRMYDELLELVASDVEAGGIFAAVLSGHEDDPSRDAVPLRLLGGLHRLVLDGRAPVLRRWYPSTGGTWDAGSAWPEIKLAAAAHAESLRAALGQPPQTNEVGRSAALIGALLHINHEIDFPIRLFEIGSSAGLNLRADHYHYRYGGGQWGPLDSPVIIDDAWHGRVPPTAPVRITERRGYDIAPVDVAGATGTDAEMTALSYVWPDHATRLARLRGAIAVARRVPAQLVRQGAGAAVAELTLAEGALTVLWHSITWQYLSPDERRAVHARVHELAERADAGTPFAHLMMEPARDDPGSPLKFLVRGRRWPGGDLVVLGECHPHGPPVNWQ